MKKYPKIKLLLFILSIFGFQNLLFADSIVWIDKENQEQTLNGKITSEKWDFVEFKTDDGQAKKIPNDQIISVSRRPLPSFLTKAQTQVITASDLASLKTADQELRKISQKRNAKPWHQTYATYWRFKMWADWGNLEESLKAVQELEKNTPESRFMPLMWADYAKIALNNQNLAQVKQASNKLKSLGSLGNSQSLYYEGEVFYSQKKLKEAEGKFRAATKRTANLKSPKGRTLWVHCATRFGQVLAAQGKLSQAQEQSEKIRDNITANEPGFSAYYTLQGDILRLEDKPAESLYAYMRVIVQYPDHYDFHAHCLDWAIKLSQELKYTDTAKKLQNELKQKHPKYKRQAK